MERNDKFVELMEFFDNLDEYAKVDIHNQYCIKDKYQNQEIYLIEEFNDYCKDRYTPLEIIKYCSDVNYEDMYFIVDAYGNLTSFYYYGDRIDYSEGIIDYIIDNDEDFGYGQIRELLNGFEESEEVEELKQVIIDEKLENIRNLNSTGAENYEILEAIEDLNKYMKDFIKGVK